MAATKAERKERKRGDADGRKTGSLLQRLPGIRDWTASVAAGSDASGREM